MHTVDKYGTQVIFREGHVAHPIGVAPTRQKAMQLASWLNGNSNRIEMTKDEWHTFFQGNWKPSTSTTTIT